jgi:hypothetical protein
MISNIIGGVLFCKECLESIEYDKDVKKWVNQALED